MNFKKLVSATLFVITFLMIQDAKGQFYCGEILSTSLQQVQPTDSGRYFLRNDGTKLPYNTIARTEGAPRLRINGRPYMMSEFKGQMEDGEYLIRVNNYFLKQLIEGRINVYVRDHSKYKIFNRLTPYSPVQICTYFVKTEEAKLKMIDDISSIKKHVKDCPAAYSMADISMKEARRRIVSDSSYLTRIFQTFNDCK